MLPLSLSHTFFLNQTTVMLRNTSISGNIDSDHSISEEEENLEGDWSENCISLGGPIDSKGGIQVLSQFEKLRDSYQLDPTEKVSTSSCEWQAGFCVGDEVEDPVFNDEDGSISHPRTSVRYTREKTSYLPTVAAKSNSDEEITSDDEKVSLHHMLGSIKNDVGGIWSEAGREAEALVRLYEKTGCSSSSGASVKDTKSFKVGGKNKAKPKFSFAFQSRKENLRSAVCRNNENGTSLDKFPLADQPADRDMNQPIYGACSDFDGQDAKQTQIHQVSSEVALNCGSKEHSMAEFLDCFKERGGLLQGSSEMDGGERGRTLQIVLAGNTFPLGGGSMDDDDLPEALDNRSSSDDEENPQRAKQVLPSRTMVDQFQEAFGTVPSSDERPHLALPRPLGGGLFARLQLVIQTEKETDSEYLNDLCAEGSSKGERDFIDVRILSKSLEAKLTVCSCTFIGDGESSNWENNQQMKLKSRETTLTILFNSRICSDIELEVGNLIRVHSPWKKVRVKERGEVLLCPYFSQVQPME